MNSPLNPTSRVAGLRAASAAFALTWMLTASAFAQTATSIASGTWENASSWGAVKPATAIQVQIYHNLTLSTSTPTYTSNVFIGDGSTAANRGPGFLTINAGGVLNISGPMHISRNLGHFANNPGGDGTVVINGGTLNAAGINLAPGNANTFTGTLTVQNGGTLTTTASLLAGYDGTSGGQTAVFNVIGSSNTVTLNSFSLRNTGSLRFIADAAGVSTVNVTTLANLSFDNNQLFIDGAAYTGGPATWTLLSSGSGSLFGSIASRAVVTGFNTSLYLTELVVNETVINDITRYDLQLNISAIPEPSTWAAILGGLVLTVAIVRRRLRR
jgi:hypothetical protein